MGPSGLSERALVALRTSKLSKNCASRGLVGPFRRAARAEKGPPGLQGGGGGRPPPPPPLGYVPDGFCLCTAERTTCLDGDELELETPADFWVSALLAIFCGLGGGSRLSDCKICKIRLVKFANKPSRNVGLAVVFTARTQNVCT